MIATARRFLAATFVGAALFLAGCETTTTGVQNVVRVGFAAAGRPEEGEAYARATGNVLGAFTPLPYEQERDIGGSIAIAAFDTVGPMYPSDDLQRYVNLVGKTVARRSTRPEVEYAFAVLQSDDINAFSGPGGYIFLTSGAVKRMRSEAELAGVLAHEIIHVTGLHMMKTMRRSQFFQGISQAAAAADPQLQDFQKALEDGQDILFNRGFDKDFEFESDRLGVELAASAGYDPKGLSTYLQRIATEASEGGWMRTHPSASERVHRLSATLNGDLAGIGGAINEARFKKYAGGLR